MKIIFDPRFLNPEQQQLGFDHSTKIVISFGLAVGLSYGALKPIDQFGIPTHDDVHVVEGSSTSSSAVIVRNFGF